MRVRVRTALGLALNDVMIYFGEDTPDGVPAMGGIGGRRAAESGIRIAETVQEGKALLAPFPGEAATKAEKQRWCRESKRKLPPDLQTVVEGRVPAKLFSETEEFDTSTLPPLPSGASDATVAARGALVAK